MFKNYLIVAWRNLVRQKGLSFISIFGLALGIACFSLLVLYALNEFGFDGFHQHAAQIYRVYDGDRVWTSRQEGCLKVGESPEVVRFSALVNVLLKRQEDRYHGLVMGLHTKTVNRNLTAAPVWLTDPCACA